MAGYIIRPAEVRDQSRLAEVKGEYIRAVYRGFISREILDRVDTEFCTPEFAEWFADDRYRIDVMEHEGRVEGYIVYGPDLDAPGYALIADARTVHPGDAERKRILIENTLSELSKMGYSDVHMWLVHDNFRIRFLFESVGFRRDGEEKMGIRTGQEMHIVRYLYHIGPRNEKPYDPYEE